MGWRSHSKVVEINQTSHSLCVHYMYYVHVHACVWQSGPVMHFKYMIMMYLYIHVYGVRVHDTCMYMYVHEHTMPIILFIKSN